MKQCAPEQPIKTSKEKSKKYLEINKKGNITYQSIWNIAKAVLRRTFIVINTLRKKKNLKQTNITPQGTQRI